MGGGEFYHYPSLFSRFFACPSILCLVFGGGINSSVWVCSCVRARACVCARLYMEVAVRLNIHVYSYVNFSDVGGHIPFE